MKKILVLSVVLAGITLGFYSCQKDSNPPPINIFSVKDDINLGKQVKEEIESNDTLYPILDSATYPEAYAHIYSIRDSILNSGKVTHKDDFPWYIRIVHLDTVINAFACPGGYMYFYTGIIKTLDNEAQFAGVMAHEMAHVERRHSTSHLTKVYGISVLLSVMVGDDPGLVAQITASLLALKFSRDNEYEADEFAVRFLYETSYNAPSLGDFFTKLEGLPRPPEFLSTHPSPENRLEKINEHWQNLGGKSGELYENRYQDFKNSLP